jgi:predicted amidohydrolase YtcJ
VIAFGSDWSVSSANPFWQMETAITRKGPLYDKLPPEVRRPAAGVPFLPEERITLPEALAAFTINAAYTNRDEKNTGSLEVGKRANLAVLDRNLFDIAGSEISETRVLMTLFEGKPVHGTLEEL